MTAGRSPFELALVLPHATERLKLFEEFLTALDRKFPVTLVADLTLLAWSGNDTVGLLLGFDRQQFLPHHLQWFKPWAQKLEFKLVELMALPQKDRAAFKDKWMITADFRLSGGFDRSHAIKALERRLAQGQGRKLPRYEVSFRVTFKNAQSFVEEYARNISRGGIFVAVKQPLPVRSRIELVLFSDSAREVKVIGEVVQVVSGEEARLLGKEPGMGIQFVEFEGTGKIALEDYLTILKTR